MTGRQDPNGTGASKGPEDPRGPAHPRHPEDSRPPEDPRGREAPHGQAAPPGPEADHRARDVRDGRGVRDDDRRAEEAGDGREAGGGRGGRRAEEARDGRGDRWSPEAGSGQEIEDGREAGRGRERRRVEEASEDGRGARSGARFRTLLRLLSYGDPTRTGWRRWYGESPLHLVVLLASFALAGYAGVRLLAGDWLAVAGWFVGAAVLHDLVLVPLYALADRALQAAGPRRGGWSAAGWINHVRVPAFVSGLLLVVWFPLVLGRVSHRYRDTTALSADVYLGRWLLITVGLFAASAVWLAVRVWRGRGPGLRGADPADPGPSPGPADAPARGGPAE